MVVEFSRALGHHVVTRLNTLQDNVLMVESSLSSNECMGMNWHAWEMSKRMCIEGLQWFNVVVGIGFGLLIGDLEHMAMINLDCKVYYMNTPSWSTSIHWEIVGRG